VRVKEMLKGKLMEKERDLLKQRDFGKDWRREIRWVMLKDWQKVKLKQREIERGMRREKWRDFLKEILMVKRKD
jgi:hypothetical protein